MTGTTHISRVQNPQNVHPSAKPSWDGERETRLDVRIDFIPAAYGMP